MVVVFFSTFNNGSMEDYKEASILNYVALLSPIENFKGPNFL